MLDRMSMFEYVSVFISIILGLAVVHLLSGLSLKRDAPTDQPNPPEPA